MKKNKKTKSIPDISKSRPVKSSLTPFIRPLLIATTGVLYLLFRNNLADYGYLIIAGPMVLLIIFKIIILIPFKNNPEYRIYYLFHPTIFIKLGILLGIIFSLILYFFAQCTASYSLSFGFACVNKLLANPSSFFGN